MKVFFYFLKIAENDFYFAKTDILSEEKSKELIEIILKNLNKKGDGVMETLNLQVTYELAHVKEEDKVDQIKSFFDSEINNLIKEITAYQSGNKKDYDSIQIHKKIFSFLLIKTRQNTLNSLNEFEGESSGSLGVSTEREIYAILDNVLPKSGLPPFVSLSATDKIDQLNDLCNIVMGIRLLNGEIGKGGIGLLTLSDLRKRLGTELLLEVKNYYNKLCETADKFTEIYENVDLSLIVDNEDFDMLEKIRKFILYYRQVLTYLSMLMDDLHGGFNQVESLSDVYDKEVKYLIEIVEKKSAISKEQAYPRFENLAKMYIKFQEQSFILNIRENVFHKLQNFVTSSDIPEEFFSKKNQISIDFMKKKFSAISTTIYNILFKVYQSPSEIKQEESNFNFEAGVYQNGVTILLPQSTADFLDIKLEFQGFCIVTLMKKEGLLVNGKPSIVAKFKDKYLVFYDSLSVQDFLDNPDYYFDNIRNYVMKNPFLINLLNLTEEFHNANLSVMFRDKDMNTYKYKQSSVMVDKFIQTPVHFYENGNIDLNYVWNEWDLKKRALQLADIMKKTTVSSQTYLSHFRRENETQVWPLKDQSINTTVSKGTNLSIEKSYVPDLRKYNNKY